MFRIKIFYTCLLRYTFWSFMKSKFFLFLFFFNNFFGSGFLFYLERCALFISPLYCVYLHFKIKDMNDSLGLSIRKLTPEFIKNLELESNNLNIKIGDFNKMLNNMKVGLDDFKGSLDVYSREININRLMQEIKKLDLEVNKLECAIKGLYRDSYNISNQIGSLKDSSLLAISNALENAKKGLLIVGQEAKDNLLNASGQDKNKINKLKSEILGLSEKINFLTDQNKKLEN
jgi:hypothetical protein